MAPKKGGQTEVGGWTLGLNTVTAHEALHGGFGMVQNRHDSHGLVREVL